MDHAIWAEPRKERNQSIHRLPVRLSGIFRAIGGFAARSPIGASRKRPTSEAVDLSPHRAPLVIEVRGAFDLPAGFVRVRTALAGDKVHPRALFPSPDLEAENRLERCAGYTEGADVAA